MDLVFHMKHSHSMAKLVFYLFGENLILVFGKDLGSPLIFVLFFLKGKQNKKENPKCDFLFGKDSL